MERTFLLTGARAPVTLDLARGLSRAGHRVIGAESLSHALSRRSKAFSKFYSLPAPNSDPEGFRKSLLDITHREGVEIVIPTCEEVFHLARFRDEFGSSVRVYAESSEKLGRLHSKVEFNHWACDLGLTAPLTFRARNREELRAAIECVPGSSVVLKPEFSRFASKALLLEKSEALRFQPDGGTAYAVQERLHGPEYCTYSFAVEGKLLSHLTYAHEFTAGQGAGICFQAIDHPAIEEWVRSFVAKTAFTGQIAFDFIEDLDGSVRPLECNPRATSGLHLIAHDPGFLALLAGTGQENGPVRPEAGRLGQLRLAMLAYGLPSVDSFSRLKEWIRIFFGAREVVYDWADPLPFFDQFRSFYHLIRDAKRLKITPLEVSTRDIEWNGP